MCIPSVLAKSAAICKTRLWRLLVEAQCGGNTVGPSTSYGYLQLDSSAKKRKRRLSTLRAGGRHKDAQLARSSSKRWVTLPGDAKVDTGPLQIQGEFRSKGRAAPTLRSCLRAVDSLGMKPCLATPCNSTSTVDTLNRRVNFGNDAVSSDVDSALVDWFFVDRDTCGISLYNYDPREMHLLTYEYFLSSPYGRFFEKELSELHARQKCSARPLSSDELDEERRLDEALKLAGVDERLVEKPDDYPQRCLRQQAPSN